MLCSLMLVGMWDGSRLVPSRRLSCRTRHTGNQSVNVDCLAFSGGRVTNLHDQGRRKSQNFPRARPQFGKFAIGRPNAREGPVHPDELTDSKSLLFDTIVKVTLLGPRRGVHGNADALMCIAKSGPEVSGVRCRHRRVMWRLCN